jgi:hypothetical protein
MDPLLLTFLRASIAGLLAVALLVGFRQKRPRLVQLVPLIIISSGVVIGNNNGSISCTASRVAGREPLKIITPSKP